jgi:hypothetical protein
MCDRPIPDEDIVLTGAEEWQENEWALNDWDEPNDDDEEFHDGER